jgi:S-formylglutathione hydrolase FrmB
VKNYNIIEMKKLLTLIAILIIQYSFSAKVDTVSIKSPSMDKIVKNVIITPDTYKNNQSTNVLYLLHGAWGCYSDWILKVPNITKLADQYNIMIVCPDGDQFGWYLDSPLLKEFQYETYLSKELINYVDKNYKTNNKKNGRAIAGLSMGGHGALSLAIKHQNLYGAAGSMSGALDICTKRGYYEIDRKLGKYAQNIELWKKNSVYHLIDYLENNSLKIIIDCGVSDYLYKDSKKVHDKLVEHNIKHDYVERPGRHDWKYWSNSIKYQMLFFNEYFKNSKK